MVAPGTKDLFRIEAIATDVLERIRVAGQDDFGNPMEVTVDAEGGAPLRCCLRPAAPGARITLIAYRHSRNLYAGCFMFAIRRATATP
ncbi:MAG: DUF1203 domain-containing protein [Actinobacteria bacterium]|nr:DUF1203 domain-containing protein [Actinomycetota bacterium]